MRLPDFLKDRYIDWKKNISSSKKKFFKSLENEGQKPKAMIISCCDSRVNTTKIFKAEIGDFFAHKNIANLVPPLDIKSDNYGTLSTIEYAVNNLKIQNIIILGHSNCGGIEHAFKKFSGELNEDTMFIDKWLHTLKKTYEKIDKNQSKINCINDFEKLSIINSISNLTKFPLINNLIFEKKLRIYGLWIEIKSGNLMIYNEDKGFFENISN